ncbi:hypothetical protein [Pseudorhodoferax sp. Leaf265]|jgi:hypothetical protein|uniref:hypothetical protein n=1 Tax=Pseudorhodoferax sp. Leaf265 TaxID=1736315 RepID=UPI000700F1AA|nr:hypothetical protein [Pseudorhodoferax sp. Leaf265]KQP05236.1 hypothetical protein ASF45_12010 [Pseudorhodoferax sp. Leaf265]PZP96702.1 MAG: hypothetical protein DI583_19720 [Variovorax paradoxus]PZQ07921.1 MAG: hypothetical protein DI587_19720 [Variovorax paradoxus]
MEAALFTLDVIFLVLLILAVRRADRKPAQARDLGVLSYLNAKTDDVQRGLRAQKGAPDA